MSPSDYILSLFRPNDLLAVMLMKGTDVDHWYAAASQIATEEYMFLLRKKNEAGWNIYVCMNPLTAKRRVKENVAEIRTVYADIDANGEEVLDKIRQSSLVPNPHFVIRSSPGKFYAIWIVKGIEPDAQEQLLRAMIGEFGSDPAASDRTRVLRLSGFVNHKYSTKPVVEIVGMSAGSTEYTAADFKIKVVPFKKSTPVPATIADGKRNDTLMSLAGSLRRRGAAENVILAALQEANRTQCKPPLDDNEVAAIAKSAARYEPADDDKTPINTGEIEQADMPRGVLVGRLGDICEQNLLSDFPLFYAWPALITAASVLIPEYTHGLHNLYTALIGPVNFGKSQCIDWAIKSLRVGDDPKRYTEEKSGSAERLLKRMNHLSGEGKLADQILINLDEWKFFFDKAAIEGSVFPTLLTSGFYKKNNSILDSHGRPLNVPASLSWIGGIVTDVFEDCFSRVTALGLYDRFLLGVTPSDYLGFNYRPFDGQRLPDDFEPARVEINNDVWGYLREWKGANPQATREGELALRIAIICAGFDGTRMLYARDLNPHLILAEGQMKLREVLKPNVGETPDAQCAIKVENYLRMHGAKGEWLDFRAMMRAVNYQRFGPSAFSRVILGLTVGLKIAEISERTSGSGRPAKVIRLVPE